MTTFTKTTTIFLTFFLLLTSMTAQAQIGMYDVRFNLNRIECTNNKIFIDLDIRANSETTQFNLTDQNFRFSYDRDAVALQSTVITEQKLVGFVPPASFYDPHTLTGSLDTIVSYNVVLAGGEGVLVTTDWLTVGTISFDIIDPNKCLNLKWHDHAPENFPPTFVGEKDNGILFSVEEGNYYNETICLQPVCGVLPIELAEFSATEKECAVTLGWSTKTELNNEYFLIEKSTDGFEFTVIGKVQGSGTTHNARYYSFVDEELSLTNYYRLTQVDFDGTSTTTEVLSLKSKCYIENNEDQISALYPNPVINGDVNIKFYASASRHQASILVTDVMGRLVLEIQQEVALGNNTLSIPTDGLSAGTYFAQIIDEDWSTDTRKFVKVQQ